MKKLMRRGSWPHAALLVAATALVWLIAGVAGALGSWVWWAVAALPTAALLVAPILLFWLSGERTWPTWVAFAFVFVLLLTAYAGPGDWYLRAAGTHTTATVREVSCLETSRGRCLYRYTLHDASGTPLPGEFRDTVEYEYGSPVDVVVDPRGLLGPRLAADLDSRVFDVMALVGFAGFAATAAAATAVGRVRRDPDQPAPAPQVRP
ncbi:hypothetical protein ABT297_06965 [Dactylosporangium sp. NPDC000555]|uniref:hypothetical protein n=1 Tax=Dactylosporangium sp. NPDC000555 TaxID=3154260 RepID=UPI003318A32E